MNTTRRRFTEAQRARILAAAEQQGLSGPKAAKKFGISTLTFYNWRKAARVGNVPERADGSLAGLVRAQVQAKVRDLIPGIVEEEVSGYLIATLGRARRFRA